ncbi:hypothetical protein ABK040_003208 [Willaertia magna]
MKIGITSRTVAIDYKNQLKDLMGLLESTELHFIRCIKPNSLQKPLIIDEALVLAQLKCNSVLEGIHIARKGYPGRIPYTEFVKRYNLLVEDKKLLEQQPNPKSKAQVILETIQFQETTQYKLGTTKVFLKASQEALIEELREKQISKIIGAIQAASLDAYERVAYKKLQGRLISIKLIQRNFRAYMRLKNWSWWSLINLSKPYLAEFSSEKQQQQLKEELEKLKKALEDEQNNKKKLETEKQTVEQQKKKLMEELDEQCNRINALNNNMNQLENEIRDRKNEIERLHSDNDSKDSDITRNTQTIAGLNANIKKLEDAIKELKNEVETRDRTIKVNQLDEESRKRQGVENKNRSLQQDLDNASSKINELDSTVHDHDQTNS